MGLAGIGYGSYGTMIYYYLAQACPVMPGDPVYTMALPYQVAHGCPPGYCENMLTDRQPGPGPFVPDNDEDVNLCAPTLFWPGSVDRPRLLVPGDGATSTVQDITIDEGQGKAPLSAVVCLIKYDKLPFVTPAKGEKYLGIGVTWQGSVANPTAAAPVEPAKSHYRKVRLRGGSHCYHVIHYAP